MSKRVKKKVCRKTQGIAEPGNTCLTTPGTCESCPDWHKRPVGIVPKCSRKEADEIWSQLVHASAGKKLSDEETYKQMAVHDKVNVLFSSLNNGQRATILEMIRLDMVAQLEEKENL